MRYFTGLNSDTGQTEVINLEEEINESLEQVEGQIEEELEGKLDAPEVEGTEGQVLMTDGEGGRSWGTINGAEVKNGTDLVIAEGSDSPTIADLNLGDTIRVDESASESSTSYVNYAVVEKKAASVVLLRLGNSDMSSKKIGYTYENGDWDTYLCGDFLTRFKNRIASVITPINIVCYEIHSHQNVTLSRKVFIPTQYQLDDTQTNQEGESTSYMPALRILYSSLNDNQIRNSLVTNNYGLYYTRTPYNVNSGWFKAWGTSNIWNYGEGDTRKPLGIAINIKSSAAIDQTDGVNTLVGEPSITYTNTIDKLQDGNNYYKFSDQDARALITAIKDSTSIDSFGDVETALGNKANDSQTIDDTTKTVNGWIEYLVDEIDGVENLIGSGVISNGD